MDTQSPYRVDGNIARVASRGVQETIAMPHARVTGTAWDRHREDYAYTRELDFTGWAWEFLRRNEAFRRDVRQNRAGHPVKIQHVSGATLYRPQRRFLAAETWGLEFFADPERTAHQTDVFWLPELLTHVVACQCHAGNDNAAALTLSMFHGRKAVLAGLRDEHVAIRKGQDSACVNVKSGTFLFGKTGVTFMHDGLGSSYRHFNTMQVLKHLTSEKTRLFPPISYAEQKLLSALIALDGHLEGYCLRDIATVLHGADAVQTSWVGHTNWMKSSVRRAVTNGKELMNGGYRRLL